MKYDFEITEELTEDNERSIFNKCCTIGFQDAIFKIGLRYFQIYFGPDWDSWDELFDK